MADTSTSGSSMWSLLIPLIGMIASSAIQSASQPKPKSFGTPENMSQLYNGLQTTKNTYNALADNIGKGVSLRSSYAQSPPTLGSTGFSGGGLPMDIGVSGADPALKDPSLLSLEGIQIPHYGLIPPDPNTVPYNPVNPHNPDPDPTPTPTLKPGPSPVPEPGGKGGGPGDPGGKTGKESMGGFVAGGIPSLNLKDIGGAPTPINGQNPQDDTQKALAAFKMLGLNVG